MEMVIADSWAMSMRALTSTPLLTSSCVKCVSYHCPVLPWETP